MHCPQITGNAAWALEEVRIDVTATDSGARVVAALLLYFTILHIIGAPFPRYSVPLRPFQYGMALFGLHYIIAALKSRKV